MKRRNRYTEKRKRIVTLYGQWKYPGMVTTIPSNDITMKGVPYPVLGVSDKGDIKMMYPDNDYKFKGNEVTEYPMGKYATGMELHNPLKNMTVTSRYSNGQIRDATGTFHRGIDLRAAIGDSLYSTGDGVIRKIVTSPNAGGNFVVIESPDRTIHTYMHLSGIGDKLKVGQQVKAGDLIGYTGASGMEENSYAPHLHYQVQLLPEGKEFKDFDNNLIKLGNYIDPLRFDWDNYTGHGLIPVDNPVYDVDKNAQVFDSDRNPVDTSAYEMRTRQPVNDVSVDNIYPIHDTTPVDSTYTHKYYTPAKLMFPPLFKNQTGGIRKYLEGNYTDSLFVRNRWKPQEEYNDSSWANFLGAGIGAMVPISIALWNKYGNQSNNKSNTLPSDMRDDYSYQRTHHYPVDNSINTDVQQQINDDAENKLKISQNMNFTGPISVTPWNYTMKPFKINYEFPFKSQIGKYLSGNYVNNVISQWNNKFAESISKGDSLANMIGTGINAAASIAGSVLNQWGANHGKQDWMTASKEQLGNNTGTMAEIERGEVISTPNGMSIANPNANYHELYTNQNENNGTVVNLSNDVNKDVAKNPTLSRKSTRVNKYTSMRRQGRSFIFPSTVGIGGLLEPKNGVEYPLAENINGKKQTGDYIKTAASFLPIVGTAMDAYELYKNPTWENAGYLGLSLAGDVMSLIPGLQFGKAAINTARLAHEAKLAKILAEQKRIDKTISLVQRNYKPKDAKYLERLRNRSYELGDKYRFVRNVGDGTDNIEFMRYYTAPMFEIPNFGFNYHQQFDVPTQQSGGSIHIKPSKRGTFTAAATKHGMGVQEFASKVLANPDNYSEAMRKKAQFARNASHWKHQDGGKL